MGLPFPMCPWFSPIGLIRLSGPLLFCGLTRGIWSLYIKPASTLMRTTKGRAKFRPSFYFVNQCAVINAPMYAIVPKASVIVMPKSSAIMAANTPLTPDTAPLIAHANGIEPGV